MRMRRSARRGQAAPCHHARSAPAGSSTDVPVAVQCEMTWCFNRDAVAFGPVRGARAVGECCASGAGVRGVSQHRQLVRHAFHPARPRVTNAPYRDAATFVTWSNTLPTVGLVTTTCAREPWSGLVVGPELPGPAPATTTSGEARATSDEVGRTLSGVGPATAPTRCEGGAPAAKRSGLERRPSWWPERRRPRRQRPGCCAMRRRTRSCNGHVTAM